MTPTIETTTPNVITIKFDDVAAGWEQWVLLRSDAHHDSRLCNRNLETEHLQLAQARKALILDGGDLFDAMQGRHDRRSSYDEVRPEDVCADYYGSIVRHAAEYYKPYTDNWLLLARGNHETGVMNHANTDITSQLAYLMNDGNGGRIKVGGFEGWVRFRFKIQTTVKQTVNLRYAHGSGNSAPVTRGVIQTNRQAVWQPDADIVWNGHNHQAYLLPIKRERVSQAGKVWHDLVWFVRTPGYKGRGEWDIEKGHEPTPDGCAWLRFYLDARASMVRYDLMMDLR